MADSVPDMLRDAASTYEYRNTLYGDNYKHYGAVMHAIFQGKPVVLNSVDDHNRFGVFCQIVSKITRYAAQFNTGGHDDSLLDEAVYSMMLRELDQEIRERPEGVPF